MTCVPVYFGWAGDFSIGETSSAGSTPRMLLGTVTEKAPAQLKYINGQSSGCRPSSCHLSTPLYFLYSLYFQEAVSGFFSS